MASSISRTLRASEPRSGGKMVRARRTGGPKTPYDRPQSSPNSSPNPQNPNWLSRLIYSPTRMLATGAGKLLSSVFTNDDSSSSSSSDSDSEEDIDDENENDATDTMKKKGILDIIEHVRSAQQPTVGKSETKRLIEQLLVQVTFSREECNRLTGIIKSRVVDSPVIGDTEDWRLSEPRNRTIGSDVDIPDYRCTAVMEAKRWLEEKKSGSSPNSELELGTCALNSAMSPHVYKDELGSPVDMAKSYMQTRPPWASPSANHIECGSPSPTGIQLFKEETPYSTGYTSFTSSKMKKDSPASGSWNILEEIRKVRSKATEEMLRTPPSSKIDWSSFALENKSISNSLMANEALTSLRDKVHSSAKPVAASVNVATGLSTSYGFPVPQVAQDMLPKGAVPPNPATAASEQNQALEGIQSMMGTTGRLSSGQIVKSLDDIKTASQSDADAANIDGPNETNGSTHPFSTLVGGTAEDLLNKQKCPTSKELTGKSGSFAVNGFPTSESSLSPGQDREQDSRPSNENHNPVASGHDKVPPSAPTGEAGENLSEASIDVPDTHQNDSIATCSQNSSSMQKEGLSQDLITPSTKRRKTTGAAEEQQGKKPSRYNRRGKGRGK
ncbi:hypothetical protein AB3S75_018643 [Citrus x aurantiifolia]